MTTLIDTRQRKAFSPEGEQFAWDSTSLQAAKKCPRYYKYSILDGWRAKAENAHLKFGILLHSALEELDHRRVAHKLEDSDLIDVLRITMLAAGTKQDDGTFTPWHSPHTSKNLESLVRTIIWYFDQYRDDAFQVVRLSDGRAAVELSFRFPLPSPPVAGQEFLYCGHLDSLGEYGGQLYFLDRKTTGSALGPQYFSQFSPNVQITGYTLACRIIYGLPVSGGIIDAMQVLVGSTRFGRAFEARTEAQLEEWMAGTLITIKQSQRWLEDKFWPMNETACGMYGGCTFQQICSKDPSVRERFLEANFDRSKPWDPLETRGKL